MANALSGIVAVQKSAPLRDRLSAWTPRLVILPSALASFVYVFVFTLWTLYVSMSDSSLLPTYHFVGLKPYFELWSNQRWSIAYGNLFYFSAFYVVLAIVIGLALAIAIDQRVKGEAIWRTIFLYPLAVSFIVTGSVWNWLYSPNEGIEHFVRSLGWADRKVILPSIAPIFIAVAVVLLQFAIKTFDLVVALTQGGPGIATTFPANYVYDLMFQRGQIAIGAAASIMMLLALATVLVPYAVWTTWRSRRGAARG